MNSCVFIYSLSFLGFLSFFFLYFNYFLFYALVISSSSIWLSRCSLISMAGQSIRSIWWTFKCTTTFTNIITIKYTWNSRTISYLLSSFDWYTWYTIYSSSNRLMFLKIYMNTPWKWLSAVCILNILSS